MGGFSKFRAVLIYAAMTAAALFSLDDETVAQTPPPDKPMTVEKIQEGLYVIRGPFSVCGPQGCRGASPKALADGLPHEAGDVAVRVTPKGVIVVDDKFSWDVPELIKQIKSITSQPVKYVLNTHYHQDHTGGNAAMIAQGFELITQANLRDEIIGKGGSMRKEPAAAPEIVFGDYAALYLGGVEVQMFHFGAGHTAGDTFVYFPDLKVVHTGDALMDGVPVIDYRGGGTAVGLAKSLHELLKLDFQYGIPGHGPVYSKEYAQAYVQKLETMNLRMMELVKSGVPKNQAAAALKLGDLGWDHTDSTDTFLANSVSGYYDEMAAALRAEAKQ